MNLSDLRAIKKQLKRGSVKPFRCTAKEAEAHNKLMKALGIKEKPIKAGDLVYRGFIHPSWLDVTIRDEEIRDR